MLTHKFPFINVSKPMFSVWENKYFCFKNPNQSFIERQQQQKSRQIDHILTFKVKVEKTSDCVFFKDS